MVGHSFIVRPMVVLPSLSLSFLWSVPWTKELQKPDMSSLLVFYIVYRLEIKSVMLVFFDPSCEPLPLWADSEPTLLLHPPPQTKTPVKTTFRDWCLHSSFVHTAMKIPFMYSFSGNCAASVPIFILKCLWAIYIRIPRKGPHIFLQQNRQTDHGRNCINPSQIYECRN